MFEEFYSTDAFHLLVVFMQVKVLREARQVVSDLKASPSSSMIPGKLQEASAAGPGKPNRTGAIKPQSVKMEESKA